MLKTPLRVLCTATTLAISAVGVFIFIVITTLAAIRNYGAYKYDSRDLQNFIDPFDFWDDEE